VTFDGLNNVINATTIGFNETQGTLEVWIKPTNTDDRDNYTIISTPTEIANESSLVLFYHMNENSINTCSGGVNDVCDSSGHGNDGEFYNQAAFTTDSRFGPSAVTFDGTDDAIKSISINFDSTMNSFTAMAWFKTTGGGTIFGSDVAAGGSHAYIIRVLNGKNIWNMATLNIRPDNAPIVNDGKWHHSASVRDGNTIARLYVDGIEVGNQTDLVTNNDWTTLCVGSIQCDVTPTIEYTGIVDELA